MGRYCVMKREKTPTWFDFKWNPIKGCKKIWLSCDKCEVVQKEKASTYAMELLEPKKIEEPSHFILGSSGDIFYEGVPIVFLKSIFKTIQDTPQHTYTIITRRPAAAYLSSPKLELKNIRIGVIIENQTIWKKYKPVIKLLAEEFPVFLFADPLIGELILDKDISWLSWIYVCGEKGKNSREMFYQWVYDLKSQAIQNNIPFYFDSWGTKSELRQAIIKKEKVLYQYSLPTIWKEKPK